jgi:hypothetical protein
VIYLAVFNAENSTGYNNFQIVPVHKYVFHLKLKPANLDLLKLEIILSVPVDLSCLLE